MWPPATGRWLPMCSGCFTAQTKRAPSHKGATSEELTWKQGKTWITSTPGGGVQRCLQMVTATDAVGLAAGNNGGVRLRWPEITDGWMKEHFHLVQNPP